MTWQLRRDLVESAEVVIRKFRPGVMNRLGLGASRRPCA